MCIRDRWDPFSPDGNAILNSPVVGFGKALSSTGTFSSEYPGFARRALTTITDKGEDVEKQFPAL